MKTLKFADELVDKVLSGEKTKTWRLWDDKNLQTGDIVLFIKRENRIPFAKARLTQIVEKHFGDIDDIDCIGHETYKEDRYKVYSKYYSEPVSDDTPTKIISFEILKKLL